MACGTSPNIGFYMNAGRSSDDYTDNVISENYLFCRHTMICASTYTVMWYRHFNVWGNSDLIYILEKTTMMKNEWMIFFIIALSVVSHKLNFTYFS